MDCENVFSIRVFVAVYSRCATIGIESARTRDKMLFVVGLCNECDAALCIIIYYKQLLKLTHTYPRDLGWIIVNMPTWRCWHAERGALVFFYVISEILLLLLLYDNMSCMSLVVLYNMVLSMVRMYIALYITIHYTI